MNIARSCIFDEWAFSSAGGQPEGSRHCKNCEDWQVFDIDLWHHELMKALKSKLAIELLADPKARVELRRFLLSKRPGASTASQAASGQIQIHRGTSAVTVNVTVVPKAQAG